MAKKTESGPKNPKQENDRGTEGFALGILNYKLMGIGFVIIVIGFILLAGGGSDDPNIFNPEIFNFRRIILAPVILLFGFIFEIYAIMKKTNSGK